MKKFLSKKTLNVILHLLLWGFLFSIPRLSILHPLQQISTVKEIFLWILAIVVFYLNYHVLIPRLLTKRKFFLFALVIFTILNFTFISSVFIETKYVTPGIGHQMPEFDELTKGQFSIPPLFEPNKEMIQSMQFFQGFNSVIFIFVILAISTSIKITLQWYSDEKIRKDAENQKLNAELSFLKSQINPHFFFNTLNSIYSLATKKSDKTPEAIIKLSQLMRYIIYDSEKDMVPFNNEIEYIKNFVELQKLRLRENVFIDLKIYGNTNDKWIEPLLLLPFIENAFKHGIDYTEDCTIKILISINEDCLLFETENQIVKLLNQTWNNKNSGIGLPNSEKRLSLLYPGNHSLNISNENGLFKTILKLTFKNPAPVKQVS
jgi:two-component system, LytTR family, sensor kinase